jgi:ribonuclease Z
MLEVLFLGTGASMPSRDRSMSCIAVRCGGDIALLDCGEGSQRQIMVSPFSFMKIRAIFITHLHGDHVLGLPGLLQTMSLVGRKDPLTVYGPPGIEEYISASMSMTEGSTEYPLEVRTMSDGDTAAAGCLSVSAYSTEHGIPSLGFVVKEPDSPGKLDRSKAIALGIKDGPDMARLKNGESVRGVEPSQVVGAAKKGASVSYTGDTMCSDRIAEVSSGVDMLIHESTYAGSETELAREHLHSTCIQAAETAKACGAGCLILTHVSNRHKDRGPVVEEARTVFENTFAAEDMDLFQVKNGNVSLLPKASD